MNKPYFTFRQNNSFGRFDFSQDDGITVFVVIQANDASDANVTAITKGLYFDGCDSGTDCSCCGDRWDRVDDSEATDSPMVYGEPVETHVPIRFGSRIPEGRDIAVHHADGRVEWFGSRSKSA